MKIDKTPPTASITVVSIIDKQNKIANLSFSYSDSVSGVKDWRLKNEGGDWMQWEFKEKLITGYSSTSTSRNPPPDPSSYPSANCPIYETVNIKYSYEATNIKYPEPRSLYNRWCYFVWGVGERCYEWTSYEYKTTWDCVLRPYISWKIGSPVVLQVRDNAGNIAQDSDTPFFIEIAATANLPCTADPTTTWIDCPATATLNCIGCDFGGYKIYYSNPGSCPSTKSEYTSGLTATITNHSWVCGYGETTGKGGIKKTDSSGPLEVKVNRTFVITVTARTLSEESVPLPSTPVSAYLCTADIVYCDADHTYLTGGSTVSGADGSFTIVLVKELTRGQQYKTGVVTTKGYSETIFTA